MTAQQAPFFRFMRALAPAAVFSAALCGAQAQVQAQAQAQAEAQAEAQAPELEITRGDCEHLNTRNAAVSAEYQPGVDVRGKPVKGADVDGGAGLKLPDTITVPIGVDLAQRYNMGAERTALGELFTVTVKDGQVRFNGERLGGEAETAVKRACRDAYGG